MNDSEYRSYFQKRLSTFKSDKVPEFDQFFTKAELNPAAIKPNSFRLWPVMLNVFSAAAILVLVVLIWPRQEQPELLAEDVKEQVVLILPDASSIAIISAIKAFDEPVLLTTQAKPSELKTPSIRCLEIDPAQISVLALTAPVEIAEPEIAAVSKQEQKEIDATQEITTASKEKTRNKRLQNTYERSIEEAHNIAIAVKQENSSGKLRLGFAINQNNGLLASVSPNNYQSMVASMGSGYQDSYAVLNAGSLMRSASVSPNAWEKPGNLVLPIVEKPKYHFPLNLSISISLPLWNRVELQTGLSYSYLAATTQGATSLYTFTLFQELYYLGIPLRVAYRIIDNERFGMYASLGGSIEKGLVGKQKNTVKNIDNTSDVWTGQQNVHGVQPIAGLQLGFDYTIIQELQLYLEPGAIYCFDTDQPLSIRTKSPLFFNLGLGLRYRF